MIFPTLESSNSANPLKSYPTPSPTPIPALIPLLDQEITTVVPKSTPLTKETKLDIQSLKLLVYERLKRKENEGIHKLEQNQSLDSSVLDDGSNQNSLIDHARCENPGNSTPVEDLDIPIALRKGKRASTSHCLSDYMCYNNLSPSYRTFTTNLTSIAIPKSIQDALSIP